MSAWINGDNFGLPNAGDNGDASRDKLFNLDKSLGHIDLGKNEWLNFWATEQNNKTQLWLESDGDMVLIEEFNVTNTVPQLTKMRIAVQVMRQELRKMDRLLQKWEDSQK